ncbi:phage holin family protein [Novosphingobium sp. RD2P27]|uniref:Phage holin family protein n=1 Tax=Novosphingobium kalidii TaxID=3230299 RepID=A0ABV2D369_9SPHN
MQENEQAIAPLLSEARERSLNEDLQQLAQDARAYAEAEFQFQKSRAAYTASATKSIAVFAIAALVLVFFATMALVVGLVIALAPLITAWGSTAVVTLALLGAAVFLLIKAKKRFDRMMTVMGGEKAQ